MDKTNKAPCGYKLFMIDAFDTEGATIRVCVYNDPKSIKQYCLDTELPFKDGFRRQHWKEFYEVPYL